MVTFYDDDTSPERENTLKPFNLLEDFSEQNLGTLQRFTRPSQRIPAIY